MTKNNVVKNENVENNKFQYEVDVMKFWQEKDIFNKVNEKNKDNKLFVHVDGPPYPTGEVHLGHLRNWSIKDCVLRFKRFKGRNVYARDGYDAHGLPVENKVQAKLGLKTVKDLKDFGEDKFVLECKKYVNEIIGDMAGVRERYGLSMDRNPYYTFHPEYVSMAWRFFKKAHEQNLLYKDYKTVAWCPNDETTLSDYEIKDTYKELEDPSIYVKFPINEKFRTTSYPESFVIWTTTPWTLQSNMLIAMNANFDYSKVLIELNGKKEVLVLASSLVENVLNIFSNQNEVKFIEIVETKKGAEFEGVKYDHIYLNDTPSQQEFVKDGSHKHLHSVVLADFVTLDEGEDIFEKLEKKGYKHSNVKEQETESGDEKGNGKADESTEIKIKPDGTGLVHIAPGHGFDDYNVGKNYNVPIFCPVGTNGCFTEGKYEGKYFKDVDPIAIKYLRDKGFLISDKLKKHRYPCCWRCKTPIVYRAADQWWIKRSAYIEKNIKDNKGVKWYPDYAKVSFENLMEGAGDWAISRQRYWGIPLPIFEDEDGNYEVFESKEELEQRIGHTLEDIHRDDLKNLVIKNKKSGKDMRAVPFITDVWFDSGCASFASHYGEGLSFDEIIEKYYPMNWIIEGRDQIRGWFSSLFNVGQVVTGKAPYNRVLYQQFVMDKSGVKMSKSLGNGISGNEAINTWGADKTRYYLLTKVVPEEQINFDSEEFNIVDGFFNTLENVVKYIKSYNSNYDVKDNFVTFSNLDIEDKWILYKLNRTLETYNKHFENFKLNLAFKEVESFVINDLSKIYLKLIKDRSEARDNNLLGVLEEIVKKVLIMLAPAIPFKTEELYLDFDFSRKKESIFLEDMPEVDKLIIKDIEKKKIDENFEFVQEIIAATLNTREKAKIGVRWPLGQIDIILNAELKDDLVMFEKLIKKLTNIQKINYDMENVEVDYLIKPNFMTIKQDFDNVQNVIKAINMNKLQISGDIKAGETFGEYEGLRIDYEKHIIKEIAISGDAVSCDFSGGSVILHTKQDEILLEEGYLRELLRRVQDTRKQMSLEKNQEVEISFEGSEEDFLEIVRNWESVILNKVGAKNILEKKVGEVQEFDIKGKKLVVSVRAI